MTAALAIGRNGTACPQGHAYSEDNTAYRGDGVRYCRACNRERMAARRAGEQRYIDGDGLLDILAAVVRQALIDYAAGADDRPHMSARSFLECCGIVDPTTGVVDHHGHTPPPHGVRRQS